MPVNMSLTQPTRPKHAGAHLINVRYHPTIAEMSFSSHFSSPSGLTDSDKDLMGQVQPTNGLNVIFPNTCVDMLADKCDIDLRDEVYIIIGWSVIFGALSDKGCTCMYKLA